MQLSQYCVCRIVCMTFEIRYYLNHRFVTRPVSSVTLPDMHCSFPGIPTQLNLNHPEKRAGQRGASAEKQGRTEQSGRHERVHPSRVKISPFLTRGGDRKKEISGRKKERTNEPTVIGLVSF